MRPLDTLVLTASLLAAAPSATCQPDLGANASGDLGFGGARLGMSLGEWKALPPPRGSAAGSAASCGDDTGPAAAAKVSLGAAQREPRTVVCVYTSHLGRYAIAQDFPLTKSYAARNPTFTFVSGTLDKIEFASSIDAFDDLVAGFEAKFGPTSRTIRDQVMTPYGQTLPRVQKIWRLPGGVVRITDPSARPDQLVVDFTRLEEVRPSHSE